MKYGYLMKDVDVVSFLFRCNCLHKMTPLRQPPLQVLSFTGSTSHLSGIVTPVY